MPSMHFRGVSQAQWRAILPSVLIGLLPASAAYPQVVTAILTGTVTDASGATVPQATVTAAAGTTGISG